MKNKLLLLALISFVFFMGCEPEKKKEIAILKYVTHPALDELEDAYFVHLDSLLKLTSEDWVIKKYNANANATSANTIAKSFSEKEIELILTIATPAAIAVSNNTSDIPHIYGAVADPKGAKIIPSDRSTGIQNAGENIIKEAIVLIKTIFGNNVRIGTIYNPQEQNSLYIQKLIKKICNELNLSLKQVTVQSTSNLNGITNSLCKEVDVIYSANDNTVNSGVTSITSVTDEYNIPFLIGDLSTLKKGALFAIGLEYHAMGIELANISYDIIKNDTVTIKSYPPQKAPKPEVWLNNEVAERLNFNLTDSLIIRFNIKIK